MIRLLRQAFISEGFEIDMRNRRALNTILKRLDKRISHNVCLSSEPSVSPSELYVWRNESETLIDTLITSFPNPNAYCHEYLLSANSSIVCSRMQNQEWMRTTNENPCMNWCRASRITFLSRLFVVSDSQYIPLSCLPDVIPTEMCHYFSCHLHLNNTFYMSFNLEPQLEFAREDGSLHKFSCVWPCMTDWS